MAEKAEKGTARAFLAPTWFKIIFVVEWAAFLVLGLLRGDLHGGRQLLVASYPLMIFYLVGCELDRLSRRGRQMGRGWKLPGPVTGLVAGLVVGLLASDQLSKTLVARSLPLHSSVPIVEGWLHVAHEQNRQGSWLMSAFDAPLLSIAELAVVVVPILLLLILCYRYYVKTKRGSVWADAAFVGLFAGLASWVCDVGLRGCVIDYLQLPGVVTADLKDILLAVGGAAFVVEALDSPYASWRWEGWRAEGKKLRQAVVGFARFSAQEVRGIGQVLMKKHKG